MGRAYSVIFLLLIAGVMLPSEASEIEKGVASYTVHVDPDLGADHAMCGPAPGPWACQTIQYAIDNFSAAGKTVQLAPGTYNENIVIDHRLVLQGAGSGSDPVVDSIINSASPSTNVVRITAGGNSPTERLEIRDLRVTGGTGGPNNGNGINIVSGSHMTFSNVTSTQHDGNGVAFDPGGDQTDFVVSGCNLSGNPGGSGFRVPSTASVDGLVIADSTMDGNAVIGLTMYGPVTGLDISNSTFNSNSIVGIFGYLNRYFATARDSVFDSVTANGNGRGVALRIYGGSLTISNSTASNNNNVNPGDIGQGFDLSVRAADTTISLDHVTAENNEDVNIFLETKNDGTLTSATFNDITATGSNDEPSAVFCDGCGIWLHSLGTATLANVSITGSTISGNNRGIVLDAETMPVTNVSITGNQIKDASVAGIALTDGAAAANLANENVFAGNTTGVDNLDPDDHFDATDNWWGDPSGPFHAVTNPAGLGDEVSDNVSYDPWVAVADLAISKSDSTDPALAGGSLSYTVTVTNDGPADAAGVVVTDTLPAGVTLLSTTGCIEDPAGVPTCSLGSLADGASAQYTVAVTVNPNTHGEIINSVTVSSDILDDNPTNNGAEESTTVQSSAELSITKIDSVDPVLAGDTLIYTITVTNSGPSDAANVVVTDTLPIGMTAASTSGCDEDPNGVPVCTLGGLSAGTSSQYTIEATLGPGMLGTITNWATVSSDTAGDDPADSTASESTTVHASADLQLVKDDSQDPVSPGGQLTYSLSASNLGPSTSSGSVVTDVLPAGLSFNSSTDCSETAGTVTCSVGSLPPGGEQVVSFTVDVSTSPPQIISNSASVVGNENDTVTGNNQESELTSTDVKPPRVALVTTVDDTGDGRLSECEATAVDLSQILVTFSEPVYDPPGDDEPDDVTNALNYRLVATGPNFSFDTSSCGSVLYDDVAVGIDAVSYDGAGDTATLNLASSLPSARYRLLVCGSTSIVDATGNPLDGDGNGVGGDDYSISFRADPGNFLLNGHLDCDLEGWTLTSPTPNEISWANDDINTSTVSGSAHIRQLAMDEEFSLAQCVPLQSGQSYTFGGKVRVAAAPGVSIVATSRCELFALPSCSGTSTGLIESSQPLTATGSWLNTGETIEYLEDVESARCTFEITAPGGPDFEAWFDGLFLVIGNHLFSDGFESGDTSRWTVGN